MEDRNWRIGDDLSTSDNLLDGVTFDELILTVHCNCPVLNPEAVKKSLNEILSIRMQDMAYLLERNIDVIIAEARKGRE